MQKLWEYIVETVRPHILSVVLVLLLCVLAFACANASGIINPAYQPFQEAYAAKNAENDDAAPTGGRIVPRGGRANAGREIPAIKTGSESFEGIDGAPNKDASVKNPAVPGFLSDALSPVTPHGGEPQFNRGTYESFRPTLDDAMRDIEGFFLIDRAEFIPERSVGARGDRFESYDLVFRLPEGNDYWEVVDAYAARLQPGFFRKDWANDSGFATYFRIQKTNWNEVISIYGSEENTQIEIRVLFNRLIKR